MELKGVDVIAIDRLKSTDRSSWEPLFRDYITFYESSVSDDIIDLTFARLIGAEDGMVGLIARNDAGDAVGLVHLVFHRSTWSATWYCYLEDLFVLPAARGTGVGRSLIEATSREAEARGASRTYWATQTNNVTARKLYDRVATLTPFVQYRR